MFALDEAGRVLYINPVAVELFGFAPDALLGEVMHDRTHHRRPNGSQYPVEECPMTASRSTGAMVTVAHDTFFRCDGSPFPVSYTCAGLRTDGGGSVVVFRDISDQLAHEQQLRHELDKLTWIGRIQDALDARPSSSSTPNPSSVCPTA